MPHKNIQGLILNLLYFENRKFSSSNENKISSSTETLKLHLYKRTYNNKNIYFIVKVKDICQCSTLTIMMNKMNSHNSDLFDSNILRFMSIYDRIYDSYIYISNNIILYKYLFEGYKYHKIFNIENILPHNIPNFIPIYESYENIEEKVIEDYNLFNELSSNMILGKKRCIKSTLSTIENSIENIDNNEDIDHIYIMLLEIRDLINKYS